jgi:predicted ATPase
MQHELHLQIALGPALIATKGYADPDVTRAYGRARELCQQVGDTLQTFQMLFGLWRFYLVRAELQTAHELAGQLLSMAQRQPKPTRLLGGHWVSGATLFFQGEVVSARDHLEQGMALYDPQQHLSLVLLYAVDPGMVCRSYAAWVLWLLGYPDQALQRSQEARTLAHASSHPFTLAWAQGFAAMLHQFRREGEACQAQAGAAMTLSAEHEFPLFLALGTILRGWARAPQGMVDSGLTQLQQDIASLQTLEAEVFLPYCLSLLAGAFATAGQIEPGLQMLAEALAVVDRYGIRWWEAEIYRLQGELLLAQGSQRDAALTPEACFLKALDIARYRQVKSLELRAAMSLSRLWRQQGKPATAHEPLAEVYSWFTEGFDTTDLKEAKVLLEERPA